MQSRLGGGAPALVLDGWAGQGPERGFCAGAVDFLRCALGLGAERGRVGDLVAVSVGGDRHSAASPLLPRSFTVRHRTECRGPGLVGLQGGVEDRFCPGFDELAASGQRLLHVGGHGAGGFGNQAGDETQGLAGAAGAGGSSSDAGEGLVDDGGDVGGVGEPARRDEAWQESVNVVVVGFEPAQFHSQCAEGVRVDDGLRLLAGEPGAADQGGSAVVLGCGGDGFVFGGELSD